MKKLRGLGGWLTAVGLFLLVLAGNAEKKPTDEDCLACHSDNSLTKDVNGKAVSLFVDQQKLQHSIHGSMFRCVDCHKDIRSSPHEKTPIKLSCTSCHEEQQAAYAHSFHAKVKKPGDPVAANCEDCHGGVHQILPANDPGSPVNHANIPNTCGRCHGQKFLMEARGGSIQPFLSYQNSVHGKAIEKGSTKAAVCTDCHGAHEILPPNNAQSPISKFNVPRTCGKCHEPIQQTFLQSIHGQAVQKGNTEAPVCTDCHGIHSIKAHVDPSSSVSEQNLARATCARCHSGVRLTQEFGVAGHQVSTYLDSYHGLASRDGSVVVANCASCHGVHNILPSSDVRSTIHPGNLEQTCGQCHKGVTQRFTQTKVHLDVSRSSDIGAIAVRWIRRFYLALIFVVIGFMALHNAIIWRSKALAQRRALQKTVVRMSPNQRWQHLFLLVSFFVLVITGFALKYPHSWFADIFGFSEKIRSLLHRAAGVVLIVDGFYHLIYLMVTKEGHRLIRDLFPRLRDCLDGIQTMGYYLGLRKEKPAFGRFNYAEKAEYWALVWGTALMALTGIMLWAKVLVGNLLHRWWLDIATAIHFYEAILATLAIIIWHFYQVFFDPDVYPMNWAWFDGQMSEEKYREEHPLDVETLQDKSTDAKDEGDSTSAKAE